jgi:DNA-binding MarR family transcriptional regulator
VTTDEQDFTEAWDGFMRAMRRARGRMNAAPSPAGLSLSQYQVIEPLLDAPRAVGALASSAGIAAPTATRMLDGLARQGLVVRRASEADRRSVLVELTGEGRDAVGRKRREVAGLRRRLHASLEPGERAQAAHLLRRLAGLMEGV